jgi:hypothetical protein
MNFRNPASKKDLDGRVDFPGPVGERVHKTGDFAIDEGHQSPRLPSRKFRRRGQSAGTCSTRFVEPPNAACVIIAFLHRGIGDDVTLMRVPDSSNVISASADAAAMSIHDRMSGWSERGMTNREADRLSPTTLRRGAVPRNWQPPPGVARRGIRVSAARSSVPSSTITNRTPIV